MRQIDWDKVEAKQDGEFKRMKPGGYILTIIEAKDQEDFERLNLKYDVAEGEFAGYYMDRNTRNGWALPHFIRSYSNNAEGHFKGFLENLDKSNPGFSWKTWWKNGAKPEALNGLKVGAVMGEREYEDKRSGKIKVTLDVAKICPVADIREGKFEVPAVRKLNPDNTQSAAPKSDPIPAAAPIETSIEPGTEECPF